VGSIGALGTFCDRGGRRCERRNQQPGSADQTDGLGEMGFQPELGVKYHDRKRSRIIRAIDDAFEQSGNMAADYAYFVLFFPALVTLAPIIYNFTRQVKIISGPPVEVTIQGRTFTFLLAAALTVWGAAGQLEIQAGLIMSLFQLNKIDLHPTIVVVVLIVVVFCALPIYSWLTVNAAVRIQPTLGSHPSIRAATDFGYYSGWALL
jgi:hypothetical protein